MGRGGSAAVFVTLGLLLALPALAAAHQVVTIESGPGGTRTLRIVGDVTKNTDEATIEYDSVANEYVISHDIEEPLPPGCRRDLFEPFHRVYCPAKGITHIVIEAGTEADVIKTSNIRLTSIANFIKPSVALFFPPDLIGMEIKAGPGNDKVVDTPTGQAPADMAALHEAETIVDMGGGNDSLTLPGGGRNTIVFGDGSALLEAGDGQNTVTIGNGNAKVSIGNGPNSVTLGDGNSQVTLGDGLNTISLGDGNSKVAVGNGGDTAVFGAGNGVFTGGAGPDTATFGAGNNTFFGGGGTDTASMGEGTDQASGGPAHDILRGGPGRDKLRGEGGPDDLFGGPSNDKLFGGPALDRLNGGPGGADECHGGPAHAILRFCERP